MASQPYPTIAGSMPSLRRRERIAEIMDHPDLPGEQLEQALRGIARINRWSRTSQAFWRQLRQLMRRRDLTRLRVLETGCGDGNLCIALAIRARQAGVDLQISGCDISEVAVACARRNAEAKSLTNISFFQADAVTGNLGGDYDVGVCSLFLHHLDDASAVQMLRRLHEICRYAVLVDDLRRSTAGYWLARWGCRLLTASPVVRFDAPASVQSALTPLEALEMARQAGWEGAQVTPRWPQRYTLQWHCTAR